MHAKRGWGGDGGYAYIWAAGSNDWTKVKVRRIGLRASQTATLLTDYQPEPSPKVLSRAWARVGKQLELNAANILHISDPCVRQPRGINLRDAAGRNGGSNHEPGRYGGASISVLGAHAREEKRKHIAPECG